MSVGASGERAGGAAKKVRLNKRPRVPPHNVRAVALKPNWEINHWLTSLRNRCTFCADSLFVSSNSGGGGTDGALIFFCAGAAARGVATGGAAGAGGGGASGVDRG